MFHQHCQALKQTKFMQAIVYDRNLDLIPGWMPVTAVSSRYSVGKKKVAKRKLRNDAEIGRNFSAGLPRRKNLAKDVQVR